MLTYSKLKETKEIEPDIFENVYDVFDKGSCQCFKDCDCYKKRGQFLFTISNYFHPKITRSFDNKPRYFSTLEGLKQSIKARIK
jgi:hypothetical protein